MDSPFQTYGIDCQPTAQTNSDRYAREIYVLDTETTGLKGAPDDVVVDIGITKVDLVTGEVEEAYSSVLGYDVDQWNDYRRNAWIFENTDMTLEMVREAPPHEKVISDVRKILKGKVVTSYNIAYDMKKFLYEDPWNLEEEFLEANDIMIAAANFCKLPGLFDDYKYPKLDYAYEKILEGRDPAGINGTQNHRAYSDALMASFIMIELYNRGLYDPLKKEKAVEKENKPSPRYDSGFVTYGVDCRPIEQDMQKEVSNTAYVVELSSTDKSGLPMDVVVDIGIVKVDLNTGKIEKAYSSALGYDVDSWDEQYDNSGIFDDMGLTLDDIRDAPPAKHIIEDVRHILKGKVVTSYDVQLNMHCLLDKEPWLLENTYLEANGIMRAATDVCKLPGTLGQYRYPTLDCAYDRLVEGDPAGVKGVERRRAYADALMSANILVAMYGKGQYKLFGN